MAPKSKSSGGSALKQGTLSFASAKRGSTAAGKANTLKASPSVASVKPQESEKRASKHRSASINTTTSESSTDDDVLLISSTIEQPSSKRLKTANGQAKGAYEVAKSSRRSPKDDLPGEEGIDIKVLEKNPRVQRLYNQAKAKMGDVPPVHAEGQTKMHHILRVFDTSYEFGPCVGMTRLQRWERANALGLNPPPEVRDILLSKQGLEEDEYKQCVFYGDV